VLTGKMPALFQTFQKWKPPNLASTISFNNNSLMPFFFQILRKTAELGNSCQFGEIEPLGNQC